MIYIDKNRPEILNTLNEYRQRIECRITKKLNAQFCSNKNCKVCGSTKELSYKSTKTVENKIKKFLFTDKNLLNVICGEPKDIISLNDDFYKCVLTKTHYDQLDDYFKLTEKERKLGKYKVIYDLLVDISKGFDYDNWFTNLKSSDDYSGYHLAENLNLRSCAYCNRTYTTTIRDRKKGKLMRPQFDHWYPKSKFPLLALSFFNLIPSCYTCNSIVKSDTILELKNHIHPYVDLEQTNEFSFGYFYVKSLDRYRVYIEYDKNKTIKAYNTLRLLKVDQMYNAHLPELSDLIKIKEAYSDTYIKKIQGLFPSIQLNKNEIHRILFGTELDVKDFHKRPLSKFKSDILKKLEII
tara:strand:- start:510 stop:1565 length:1056 start_codon:yes stop_codon:yes gene_type:complete